jgi:cell wall-associated NlpC family hydrolase
MLFSCKKDAPHKADISYTTPVVTASSLLAQQELTYREKVIMYAKKYLGIPYKYAMASPSAGFDCSGFVNYVYKNFGISLPRSSSGFKNLGTAKNPSDFKVGDILVFYGYKDSASVGHLGIVCEANGMKSRFIHASSGKEMAVTISELGSSMYTRRFYKCIDPFLL